MSRFHLPLLLALGISAAPALAVPGLDTAGKVLSLVDDAVSPGGGSWLDDVVPAVPLVPPATLAPAMPSAGGTFVPVIDPSITIGGSTTLVDLSYSGPVGGPSLPDTAPFVTPAFHALPKLPHLHHPHLPPVPEPETYALMLSGLGLIGVVVARRRERIGVRG